METNDMARARNIKPGLFKNEDLAECSVWARYIFPGLWMLADREGRLEDRPKRIKGELLPFDAQEVDPLLDELSAANFILRYEADGVRYIQILKFTQHQAPHYSEKPSVIKPPPFLEKEERKASTLWEDSEKQEPLKGGSQPSDSLIPDSLIPDSPPPSGGGTRAKRLALDWQPSSEDLAWAVKETGWQSVKVQRVADTFRDHWTAKAGKDAAKLNWSATWRNWVRKEIEMATGRRGSSSSGVGEWATSQEGIDRMGKEVGLERRDRETTTSYRDRIKARLEQRA